MSSCELGEQSSARSPPYLDERSHQVPYVTPSMVSIKTDLAWKWPNKGKKWALENKILEPEKDIGAIWVKVYQDVCATIKERPDSE